MPFFVYLLHCTDGATYVGATVDVDHRLRQHNKEITGGAVATGSRVARGESWSRVLYVKGFPTWSAALQFEWRFKQISRKLKIRGATPVERRLHALNGLLHLDRATSKAVPYAEWAERPEIVWEPGAETQRTYFESLNI